MIVRAIMGIIFGVALALSLYAPDRIDFGRLTLGCEGSCAVTASWTRQAVPIVSIRMQVGR
ncbi:hypothetical protein ASG07_01445 [Sphingomonas sp. Leaf343]|nr:hypothetical protein ASG07_01445 [Sphingomonas sp. Leaf343]